MPKRENPQTDWAPHGEETTRRFTSLPPKQRLGSRFVSSFGIPLVVATTAALVGLFVEYWVITPPQPKTPKGTRSHWETENTSANIPGGRAEGTVGRVPDGRVMVIGSVKDVTGDDKGVQLQIEARDPTGHVIKKTRNSEGEGKPVYLDEKAGPGYYFRSNIKTIQVNECVLNTVGGVENCGAAPAEIWRF